MVGSNQHSHSAYLEKNHTAEICKAVIILSNTELYFNCQLVKVTAEMNASSFRIDLQCLLKRNLCVYKLLKQTPNSILNLNLTNNTVVLSKMLLHLPPKILDSEESQKWSKRIFK